MFITYHDEFWRRGKGVISIAVYINVPIIIVIIKEHLAMLVSPPA